MKVIVAGIVACTLVAVVSIAAVVGICMRESKGADAPSRMAPVNTAANVGKCVQGHRVLWHEARGQAAEACLAELDEVGEQTFSQTWHNFETELAYW